MFALALWSLARFRERPGWAAALSFTFAVTYAALLRPDGALAAVAFAPAMLFAIAGTDSERPNSRNEQGAPPSPRVCFCG